MKKYLYKKIKTKITILLLVLSLVLISVFMVVHFKNKLLLTTSKDSSLSKKVFITAESGMKDNGLVHEPVEYTIINNSSSSIYYLESSGGYQNPIACKVVNNIACEILPQIDHQGIPGWGEIKPREQMTGYTYFPLDKYKLVLRYLDKLPQGFGYYNGVLQGFMTEDEFENKSLNVYSETLQNIKVTLTKQSTFDICNSLKNSSSCFDTYKKEFGADDYPISVNKLGERKDLLIGEDVAVEGKIFLGYPDDKSWPGPFMVWALLKDSSKYQETYDQFFLYENSEFIFCSSSRNYIEACNGWENGKTYRISGNLHKGIIRKEDTNNSYYLDVKSKSILN